MTIGEGIQICRHHLQLEPFRYLQVAEVGVRCESRVVDMAHRAGAGDQGSARVDVDTRGAAGASEPGPANGLKYIGVNQPHGVCFWRTFQPLSTPALPAPPATFTNTAAQCHCPVT